MTSRFRLLLVFGISLLALWTITPKPALALTEGCKAAEGKTATIPAADTATITNLDFAAGERLVIRLDGTLGDTANVALGNPLNIVATDVVPNTIILDLTNSFNGLFIQNPGANSLIVKVSCSDPVGASLPPSTFDNRLCNLGIFGAVYATSEGVYVYSINEFSDGVLEVFVPTATIRASSQAELLASSANGKYAVFRNGADNITVRAGADFEGKTWNVSFIGLPPNPNSLICSISLGSPSDLVAPPGVASAISNGVAVDSQTDSAQGSLLPTPDFAGRGYGIVNTSFVNLRSGDAVGYSIVGVLPGGTVITEFLGRNQRRTWWFVRVGDLEGWINGSTLILRGDLTDVPVREVTSTDFIQPTAYIGFTGNVIYSELSATGVAICALPGESEFPVVGRNRDSSWYQIEAVCDGVTVRGWIEASKVSIRNPAALFIPVTN